MNIRFIAIEAHSFNHAANDPRKPTAYRVEADGAFVGTVHSESEEVWRTNPSGTHRTTFRGYSRRWVAKFPDGRKDCWNYSRREAVKRLVERAGGRE